MDPQVQQVATQQQALADVLAMEGKLTGAGAVLAGLQTIRVLWTKLAPPPAEEKPALHSVEQESAG
jgi:hypothetical protein